MMEALNQTDVLFEFGVEPLVLLANDEAGNSYLLIAIGECGIQDPYFGARVNAEIAIRVKMGYLDVLSAILTPEDGKWIVCECLGESYAPRREYTDVNDIPKQFFPGSDFYVG